VEIVSIRPLSSAIDFIRARTTLRIIFVNRLKILLTRFGASSISVTLIRGDAFSEKGFGLSGIAAPQLQPPPNTKQNSSQRASALQSTLRVTLISLPSGVADAPGD
jgi:hypothetical protein